MTSIISITNQKGGVGKTTTCVNLSASLSAMKRRVLMIDIDPQGNATMGSGVDKYALPSSIYHLLTGKADIKDVLIRHHETVLYDIIPSNSDVTAAEIELLSIEDKEYQLKHTLNRIKNRYDFIFIDCPPSLNMLTINALVASDAVIIPMQCEYYALEGLSALLETVSGISHTLNPKLHVQGILRTMYDPRMSLTNEVSQQLVQHFGKKIYRTIIPRNIKLAEAPSFGVPALQYAKRSRGAIAYIALAGEIVRRAEKKLKEQAKGKIVKAKKKAHSTASVSSMNTSAKKVVTKIRAKAKVSETVC